MNCEFCGCQVFHGDRACPQCGGPVLAGPPMRTYTGYMCSTGGPEYYSSDGGRTYGGLGSEDSLFTLQYHDEEDA